MLLFIGGGAAGIGRILRRGRGNAAPPPDTFIIQHLYKSDKELNVLCTLIFDFLKVGLYNIIVIWYNIITEKTGGAR